MPLFRYRAINEKGRKSSGKLSAANEQDLGERLAELGLELIDAREETNSRLSLVLSPGVRTRDLIELCIDMEELIRAGVPVLDALSDVRDATTSPRLRDVLSSVASDVGNGQMLSLALAEHPEAFNTIFVGVINAGERSGNLEDAFHHLIGHLKWTDEMNQKIRAAARYPLFVLVTTIGLALAMMLFLVPQLSEFLTSLQMELPFMTIALMATSDFVEAYWWLLLALPLIVVLLVRLVYTRSERLAHRLDHLLFRLPLIGMTLRKIALSRFAHFFTVMYKSGIGILECMETARGVVGNRSLSASLQVARERVEQGSTLTNALRSTEEFPDLVIRMVRVGEESGNLDRSLESVSYFYDREVTDSVDRMVGAVQPTLTLIVGALLVWIVLAVMGPMYDSFSNLPI